MVDHFLDWLAALPKAGIYSVLIALSAIENVFPPVPADVAVALGAFLAQRGEVSAPLLGVLCWMANTGTSAGMYYLARIYGETFFRTGWPSKLLPPEAMRALHGAYEKHGILGIFLCRLLPAIRAAVTPFAGLIGMTPLRALVPAASASALWYCFLVIAGAALGRSWEGVKRIVEGANRALTVLAVVACALAVLWLWRQARAR